MMYGGVIVKNWVKRLCYFVTGGAFIAGGILVGRGGEISVWWPAAMGIIGFALNAIGGWFVSPETPGEML